MTKSVIINTWNEQSNLQACLDSIKSWADEVVVVDMESTDETVNIARKNKVKLFSHPNIGYVEPARNFAISKSTSDWILVIDADERPTKELLAKLELISQEDQADYVWIPRSNIIFGRWIEHARWWPDYNIRFFKKNSVTWSDQIHASPQAEGRELKLDPVPDLSLQHFHYQTISQFVIRMDRYTDQQAKALIAQSYNFNWADLINKPSAEFASRYFAGSGYKDGVHGLALCLLQSVSEFVLYLKLWQHTEFKHQQISPNAFSQIISKQFQILNFWQAKTIQSPIRSFAYKLKSKISW